jgi:hypothetical protein
MANIQETGASSEETALESSLPQEHLQLTKSFFFYKETWTSIGLFLLAFLLSYFATQLIPIIAFLFYSLSAVFLGIGTSLLASIFFARRYENIVGKGETNLLSVGIAKALESKLEEVKQANFNSLANFEGLFHSHVKETEEKYCSEIQKNLGEYLPKKRFPRSNSPSPEYNKVLTDAFLTTNNYKFRGTQGIFIPIRLENLYKEKGDIRNLSVEILIFDPRDNDALKLHAREVYKDESMTDDDKLKNVKESIFQAIVGLYETRALTNIQLRLYRDSIFYRSEIFDNSVFITFYNQRQKFDSFPPSFQYEKNTIYYDIFDRDFKQTWLLAKERIEFNINTEIAELETFLAKLECEKSIKELQDIYNNKKREKIEQLKNS